MRVVGVLLDSPVADLAVAGRPVRDLALAALSDLAVVSREEVPEDACLVLHDPGCPTVPATFVSLLVDHCVSTGRPQVGVLPVTDTVKLVDGGRVGETLDRDALAAVATPIVLPPRVRPSSADAAGIVTELRSSAAVDLNEAPPGTIRVTEPDDVRLLAALLGV